MLVGVVLSGRGPVHEVGRVARSCGAATENGLWGLRPEPASGLPSARHLVSKRPAQVGAWSHKLRLHAPMSNPISVPHRVRHTKSVTYLVILVTRPAPTVRPPSRMANRSPSSMAIGWMSCTLISVLSPGITISVPSGSVTTPVTSVVRK